MQSYISHPRGTLFNSLISLCHYLVLLICYEKCRKLQKISFFFNFRFTEKMVFLSIAESQENMMITLSAFTKMLFFTFCNFVIYLFHCLKNTYACAMEVFNCFISFTVFIYVIFCKNCKSHPPQFQQNDMFIFFYTLGKYLQPKRYYIYYMMVGRTSNILEKSLKQRFTSNG